MKSATTGSVLRVPPITGSEAVIRVHVLGGRELPLGLIRFDGQVACVDHAA
jgi:hypothetical protein